MAESKTIGSGKEYKKRSQFKVIWFRFSKNKMAMFGFCLLLTMIILAATADLYFNYETDAIEQNISNRLISPNVQYPFGTDEYGRNMLARVI